MTTAAMTRDGCTLITVRSEVDIAGEVDIATEGRLIASASEALQASAGRPVVLDLSMLTFLSSSGFGHLVALDERARADGVPRRIVVGDAWAVFRPFAVLGLEDVLAIFRTVEDAVGADAAATDADQAQDR